MATTTFECETCFDTETIDQGGAEIACPDCQQVEIKITGLAHGLGNEGEKYSTATAWTSSTITFSGTHYAIRHDVRAVRLAAEQRARQAKLRGRNGVSSGARAIEKRVLAALGGN